MKKFALATFLASAFFGNLFATNSSNPQELTGIFDQVVDAGSKGNIAEAVGHYANAKRIQGSPKEKLEATDRIKSLFDKIRELGIGPLLQTNRISVVYFGDAFCRVRYLNTHEKGYLLWTFYGERVGDTWHSVDLRITANTDFEELVRENLYPSDTSKELVHPASNN